MLKKQYVCHSSVCFDVSINLIIFPIEGLTQKKSRAKFGFIVNCLSAMLMISIQNAKQSVRDEVELRGLHLLAKLR